jgi:adenylate cyclase class IV
MYMFMSRHQTTGQNHCLRVANKSFEHEAKLKYLGKTVKNQNCIREEIERRLNSGNACNHAVQNLSSSRLPPKKLRLKYTEL